jgi:hypothetical protein
MRWMVIYGYGVPGGALNLSFTKLLRPWQTMQIFPFKKKIPMAEPGIEPGNS